MPFGRHTLGYPTIDWANTAQNGYPHQIRSGKYLKFEIS